MKIIEAMKQTKELAREVDDLQKLIGTYCADLDFESPVYEDQRGEVSKWLQSAEDKIKEIARLREAIQRTNLATQVDITFGDKTVTKSIAGWIHRRRDLAERQFQLWNTLSDRGLSDARIKTTSGQEKESQVRRYYDPKLRDEKKALYRGEAGRIDGTLEVVNAVTDLIEK